MKGEGLEVKGEGCAFLDLHGVVDGCITNDGDAFLYGAQTVYKNFNMNTKVQNGPIYLLIRCKILFHGILVIFVFVS